MTRCYSVAHDGIFVVSGLPTLTRCYTVIACHTNAVAMSRVASEASVAVKVLESTKQRKLKKESKAVYTRNIVC